MLELNKIYNIDCTEGMKQINDKSIDMILCDLPYGQTARNKWDVIIPFDKLWEQYCRIIKDNGAIILFGNGMFTAKLMISNEKMWRYNLVWEKTQPTGFLNAKRMPLRNHEDICVFYKKLPTYNPQKTAGHTRKVSKAEHKINCVSTTDYGEHGLTTYDSTERYPKSVNPFDMMLTYAKDIQHSALHPTQKPVKLLQYLINTYSNENDIILDNCCGAGSTGIACIDTNRNYILMDNGKCDIKNDNYNRYWANISQDRINTYLNNRKSQ